jgi:hypothetical protein
MAGLMLLGNSGEVTLVASTAKSLLQIKAPANQRVVVHSIRMTGQQAAGGTDTPLKLRMTRSTANFGTFSPVTPGKQNPSDGETVQSTWGSNASVEPTSPTDSGLWWNWQPQAGIIEFLPPGMKIEIPGGQSVQFEATSGATPIVLLTIGAEE